jgi:hypothetical protein
MNIKQKLQQYVEKRTEELNGGMPDTVLCREALAEIVWLETLQSTTEHQRRTLATENAELLNQRLGHRQVGVRLNLRAAPKLPFGDYGGYTVGDRLARVERFLNEFIASNR